MADIINLRRARKAKARAGQEVEAAANRARFGSSKAEREREVAETHRAASTHEGHRREPPDES